MCLLAVLSNTVVQLRVLLQSAIDPKCGQCGTEVALQRQAPPAYPQDGPRKVPWGLNPKP